MRAAESRRADRLFDDPYAAAFVAAAPHAVPGGPDAAPGGPAPSPRSSWGSTFGSSVVIRTRFFDDYLRDAARSGIRQLVLPAAGLDTRAYRLDWPDGTRHYEVDMPNVLEFKQRVLDTEGALPRCRRIPLPADLRTGWTAPLIGAGYQPHLPTAWLVEGLLIYLTAQEAAALLSSITSLSAPGNRVAFEAGGPGAGTVRDQVRHLPAMTEYVAMWNGGLPNSPAWLAEHGWRIRVHDRADVAVGYGRPIAGPLKGGFVTAVREGT